LAARVTASIVASGSELVRGDRNDRNGPFLAASLLRLGIDPARITIVGDDPDDLEAALGEGLDRELLVVTGGLGRRTTTARSTSARAARRPAHRGASQRRSRRSRAVWQHG
jgi:nicotinamide-nucleotide amidase